MSVNFVRHLIEHAVFLKIKARPLWLGPMTTIVRNLLVAQNGFAIYNTTTNQFEFYEAGAWRTFTVMPGFAAPVNIGVANAPGVLPTIVRSDHIHNHPAALGADLHHPQLHSPTHLVGAGDPLAVGVPSNIGVANAAGVLNDFVRRDHIHNHPAALGFALHHDHFERWITNIYRCIPPYAGLAGSTAFGAIGRVWLSPITVPVTLTIDRLAYAIGDTAAGNVRIGLYDRGTTGWPDRPDTAALQVESASVAQAGLGGNRIHAITVADTQLEPEVYFIGVQGDDAAGTFGRFNIRWTHNVDGLVQPASLYNQAYGAFTDPCPATAGDNMSILVAMRVTSVP